MTLRLGGDGAITGCTSLENPDLTVSGLTISGSFDAEKVLVASGTAAAPSYTFSGDTDNGLYYAGNNSIGLSTAGTNAILIDSSGRLLVGTTAEGAVNADNLTINDSGDAGITIRSSSTNAGSLFFSDSTTGTGEYAGYLQYDQSSNYLAIGTNSAERIRIDSSGKVGIGVTAPLVKLDVVDSAAMSAIFRQSSGNQTSVYIEHDDSSGRIGTSYAAGGGAYKPLAFETSNTERMRIDSSGYVGIGETSPSSYDSGARNLVVSSASHTGITIKAGSSSYSNLYFGDGTASASYRGFVAYNHNEDSLRFGSAASERMRIDSSGRLLVGTSTGSHPLSVVSSQSSKIQFGQASDQGGFLFSDGAGSFGISGGGYYNGANWIAKHTASSHIRDDGDANIRFFTNSSLTAGSTFAPTERLRIDSSGNVGIGTSSPEGVLSVYGTAAEPPTSGTTSNSLIELSSNLGNRLNFGLNTSTGSYGAYIQASDNNLAVNYSLHLQPNGGNVGIGTTSPLRALQIGTHGSGNGEMALASSTTGICSILMGDGATGSDFYRGYIQYQNSSDSLVFATSASERLRIDSSGQLCIGCTSFSTTVAGITMLKQSGTYGRINLVKTDSGARDALAMYDSGTYVGGIIYNDTSVSYYSSSDYRLKENVVNISDGIDRLKKLSPKRFNFIVAPDATVDGFLAHEAQTVVPEAVKGEKDGEDMQGIDQSKLVPLLTAALQEAIAKIETLETKVAALETI